MRLKKIRLAGFKSFVDPTNIPFPHDMTAIVGPNGCGKSNVIDAVRWVLGESSAKNLRGDAMTDVIFNGSSARKPVSQCSVELVFDNSSGRIQGEYAGYNELSVKRVVTREAQSFYYLNSAKCRRRDVTDLFLGTGLGPRSYAIIEQGMISRLIESKPQELRVFIEEAAGISKYKERRRETENRMRHTRENLERLEDVRMELGQQLDKLQRQAAAARRYKQLKSTERELKGQLAAIRWQQQSHKVDLAEQLLQRQETDLQALIAQQRSDEKGLSGQKIQQQQLQQQLEQVQNQLFRVGNDITRLEQQQIHAKQRRGQLEQELSNLKDSIAQAQQHLAEDRGQRLEWQQQLDELRPRQQLLQAQLEQSEQQLLEADEKARAQQQQFLTQQQERHGLERKLQDNRNQLSSNENMQQRTEQRLHELQQELAATQGDEQGAETGLDEQLEQLGAQLEELDEHLQRQQAQQHQLSQQRQQLDQQAFAAKGQSQQLAAQITSLQTLYAKATGQDEALQAWQQQQSEPTPTLANLLDVEPGWEAAVEQVAANWVQAPVLKQRQVPDIAGAAFFFAEALSHEKAPGSLAKKLRVAAFPERFNRVLVSDSKNPTEAQLADLAPGQSLITQHGTWYGTDWQVNAADESEQGVFSLENQVQALQQELDAQQQIIEDLEQQIEQLGEQQQQGQGQLEALGQQRQQLISQQSRLQGQQQAAIQLQAQQLQRRSRLSEELARQQQLFAQEQEQQAVLMEQQENLQQQLEEQSALFADSETAQQHQQYQLQALRQAHERDKTEQHQLALRIQELSSLLHTNEHAVQRTEQQLQTLQRRAQQLHEEQQSLLQPAQEQAEQLQRWLAERAEIELGQQDLKQQLAEVDSTLTEHEASQKKVLANIEQLRTAMQSNQLELEGFKVRLNTQVEAIAELEQSLKEILQNLPEQASEAQWQQDLEKTAQSLSRLGAVNLAAVEEYEVQAERKAHLDAQHDDLQAALDTLEQAIRKIDRETRSRFKDTFERVNEDLKQLFPKVFGGGAAYLELTDDDLLDTGVAIMARPPGKKNSTIHLLSGGEKALTALSLVFAIFRLNPAPFCLLDEVDAPLDDANVGRFCKLVSEMSQSVQFIYITHNKIAMEMATHLTGVTMAEPGVSRMVAVDVDEAVALAEA